MLGPTVHVTSIEGSSKSEICSRHGEGDEQACLVEAHHAMIASLYPFAGQVLDGAKGRFDAGPAATVRESMRCRGEDLLLQVRQLFKREGA